MVRQLASIWNSCSEEFVYALRRMYNMLSNQFFPTTVEVEVLPAQHIPQLSIAARVILKCSLDRWSVVMANLHVEKRMRFRHVVLLLTYSTG